MSQTEVLFFLIVITLGLFLLIKARTFGKRQKARFEEEALNRFQRITENLPSADYAVYRYYKGHLGGLKSETSSLADMKLRIIADCTRDTGG